MRTGWPSIAPYGEEGEILVNHNANGLNYWIREKAGDGVWDGPYSIPNPTGLDYSYSLAWPRVVTSGPNNEIVHVFSAANSDGKTAQFYSRFDGFEWTTQWSPLFDSDEHIGIYNADEYCVSANGNTLAVVYTNGFYGHLLMFKSTDNGETWERNIVWENPYYNLDWEYDEKSIHDGCFAPVHSSVAVGYDGVVHVAASVFKYAHDELGTVYSYWYGLVSEGVVYWNDRKSSITSSDGNQNNALKLWWPNENDEDILYHSIDSVKFCGWIPSKAYNWDYDLVYRDSDYINAGIYGGSAYPSIAVDPAGNLAMAYSSPDVNKVGEYYYNSVYVSYKQAGQEGWNIAVDELTKGFEFSQTEALSVSAASNSTRENEFWFSFLGDNTPGFAFGSGASQSYPTDNYVYVSKFVPGDYGEEDDYEDNDNLTYCNVMIETFTGRNNVYEPDAHKIANDLAAANPGRVFPVNIHGGGYSPTSYPNMNTTDGLIVMDAFNINAFPAGVINRTTAYAIGRDQWKYATNAQLNRATEVVISGNVAINPLNRVAEIAVDLDYVLSSQNSTNYLTVMMLQDSIWGSQSGGYDNPEQYVDGQYCHMHVLRDIITPTWGDVIDNTTSGSHVTKTYIYEIPEIIGDPNGVEVDLNNIYFLAFVTETYDGTPTRPVLNVEKLFINEAGQECDAPSNLTYFVDDVNYNDVVLSWNAPIGADSANVTYEIYPNTTSSTPLYEGITDTIFTIMDLAGGNYQYAVRANWNGECLSNPSNMVEVTIADCDPQDMYDVTIVMNDSYGDGWNGGYIEIVGETNGLSYHVELSEDSYGETTLSLCPDDAYYFNWNKGSYDSEVGFTIYMGGNELYSIETGSIGDSFSNPFFVLRLEGIYASISDVTYTSAFCSTENNFNINVVNEGLEEITSLKMQVVVDGTNAGDGNWLYYDDGVCNDGIGGPESFYWGIMLPASTLETYVGSYMTKVSVFDRAVSSGDIMIYYGGSSSPQNLTHVQPYSLSGTNEFVEFDLTSALPVNSKTNVWVIFSTTQGTNYPASKSVNTGDPNGRWISLDGSTWGDVLADYGLDCTWMIRAYVTDETRTSVSELMPITDYNCNISEGVLKASGMSVNNTNNAERSGETIEFTWQGNIPSYQSVDIETTLDLSLGSHNVKFQIVEINGEAFKSNRKSVTVDVEEGIDTYVDGNSGDYTIDIMQGRFGNNITWELLASDNSVIASGGPYELLSSNTIKLNTETVIIPAGECVKFIVRDNNGNGFSNGGYYRIFDGKGNVVVYNEGNFGYEQYHILSVISDETMDDSYVENTFTVNVDVPGTLSYKLASMIEHWSDVYVLKVKGELNATDQQVFSKLTHLMTLDLTETNITSIGGCKELSRLRNVYLPATLANVDNQAFYNCKSLYSLDLPESKTIGSRAFYQCISLNSINIPNVTTIDYDAFYYCTSLAAIDISNVISLGTNNGIFYYCTNLSEVILSDKLTYIPQGCFYNCSSLQEIELPSSLKTIENSAFYNCALTNINIPEGITTVDNYAFYGCPVTSVSIPSSIITIGGSVFSNGAITDVYCYAATPVTTSTFGGGLSYATLHVPEFSVVAYKVHDSWYKFGNIVPLDELLSDVYINSEYTIIDYTGLADEVNLTLDLNAHLTVAAGSEFNLDSYKQITSNTEYYEYDNNWNYTYYYPSTLITYNEMNADSVEVSLTLRTDRWNFISLPFDVNVSDITYPEGTLWVVRKYSGEDRALMTGNTWHNMTDGMTLNAGEGYILHCDHADKSFVTFTFTAVNNESMNNMFSHYDVELPLATYPSEFAHNRSWNLVGNPYPSYFNTNDNIEHNGIITVWDNGYVAYSLLDDYFTLKPYESFFVQCPEGVNSMLFKAEGRSHTNDYDDYAKREEAFRQRNSRDRKIYNFTLANEDYTDRTRLVLNENASTEYEISCDASKFMNEDESVPQVYIYDNEIIYAINERPLGLGTITIGVRIGQAGEYTLTLDPKEEYNQNIVLYDNETGEEIDILNESYTFSAEEGYDHDRFVLTITENTIGIEENIILDINDPDVEVYDVMGRRVRVSDDMKTGVYIIKKGNHIQKHFIYE